MANILSIGWLFIFGIILTLVSPVAALVTLVVSRAASKVQIALFVLGIVLGAMGVSSAIANADVPEVFSLTFFMYIGGALSMSAAITLLRRRKIPARS
ncbi:MAG: hypothetical protein ACTH1D_08255 [Mycobacteriaceae bacterium]|uniref:hypothetical protein n=1 Tax=Corynebacterium sp. TaxID=1720 RepID=UPI003F9A0571